MIVEDIDVNLIRPNDYNPNEMSERVYNHLKKEYERIGYIQPIIVRKKDDFYEIIDGEHRWKAAKEMGLKKIACVILKVDDVTAKTLTINLNRIKGSDNPVKLAEVLKELEEELGENKLEEIFDLDSRELEMYATLLGMEEEWIPPAVKEKTDDKKELVFKLSDEEYKLCLGALNKSEGKDKADKIVNICRYFLGES